MGHMPYHEGKVVRRLLEPKVDCAWHRGNPIRLCAESK